MRRIVGTMPSLVPFLSREARLWLDVTYKGVGYFHEQIKRLIIALYIGEITEDWVGFLVYLINSQIYDAYSRAWNDEEMPGDIPPYIADAWRADVLEQYAHVEKLRDDILAAAAAGEPVDKLLDRSQLWVNRWNEAYNNSLILITANEGGNMVWVYGETEHCETCRQLNGIVARATEWQRIGVRPQNAPNGLLDCGGWNCQCAINPTTQRRTPGAYDKIIGIIRG